MSDLSLQRKHMEAGEAFPNLKLNSGLFLVHSFMMGPIQ